MSSRIKQAQWLSVLIFIFGCVFYLTGAAIKPEYSSASQFISELNATGSAWGDALGYLGFLPLGLLFAAFLLVAKPLAKAEGNSLIGWWLLWSQPIAFIGVAFAPCDLGCPVDGSTTQSIHNLLSTVTYFSGGISLILISFANVLLKQKFIIRMFLRFSGIAFFAIFIIMLLPEVSQIRGMVQRFADLLLASSLILIAWNILEIDHQ